MVNQILVLTHGTMSEGVKISLRVITGENETVDTLCVMENDSPEIVSSRIESWIFSNDGKRPMVIVTDIPFGSTTSTAAPFLGKYDNLYIVSGLNLGMLMGLVMQDLNEDTSNKIRQIVEESRKTLSFINDTIINTEEEEEIW